MDPAFCWKLTNIFETEEAWEQAMKDAAAALAEIPARAGTLGNSVEALRDGLDALYATARKVELAYLYAMLNAAGDNGDDHAQQMQARATRLFVDFSTASAFVDPEILSIDPEKLDTWMALPELSGYRHILDNIRRARPHTLSDREERLLAMLGDAAQTPSAAFGMFEDVDMRFPELSDGRPLTHALFGAYRVDPDRNVRREAYEKYYAEFVKYINTIATLYAGSVKQDCFFAQAHRHESALAAGLFGNNVPTALYDKLIDTVRSSIPTLERYLQARKRLMGLSELEFCDIYVPLVDEVEADMPYERAQKLVLEAVAPLGEEYVSLIKRAYDEGWIDVYENQGKTTGAFSCNVYGVHPYVLLNHANKYDDAFTLAHELGHSMHSWFSSQAQDYANNDYAIFVAEVASTVNEVLLTRCLLAKETDPKKRAYILNHLLEGFRTTVFRQTQFAEFEKRAHEMYEAGESLTAESLTALYGELNEAYYPGVAALKDTHSEWSHVPHFYNAFYVYQYATGFCAAVAIADSILNRGGAKEYLRFLSTGGSMYPIDELKIAGVDLTTAEPIERAMKVFEETLDEFVALMD